MSTLKNQVKSVIKYLPAVRLPFNIYTVRRITSLEVAASGEFEKVFPPEAIQRTAPITLGDLHYKFCNGAPGITNLSPSTYCALLKNAGVIGVSGAVVDSTRKLIGDVSGELGKPIEQHSLLRTIQFKRSLKLQGRGILVTAPDAVSNYFHWMSDALPRLSIAAHSRFFNNIDYIIVSGKSKAFQLSSLEMSGVKANVISLEEHPVIDCEELITTSSTCLSGNVPYWIVSFLRNTFSTCLHAKDSSPKKIFISRIRAWTRRLINEEQVTDYLMQEGFDVVCLEEKTLKEQVELFYNAEEIIGVHGAGFTNLVFAKAGTRVVELFPSTYVNQCYWTIACHCNLKYSYLLGEEEDTTNGINHLLDSNFTVSLFKLQSLRQRVEALV